MARRDRSPGPIAIKDAYHESPIARAVSRMRYSRLTRYQRLALDLGEMAFELPSRLASPGDASPREKHRDSVEFPDGIFLMFWVRRVAEENVLAGIDLLDAIEMFVGMLGFALPDWTGRFPDPQQKKEWTECVGPYDVEFEVPRGWEFTCREGDQTAGFRGMACVPRCHLSQSASHFYGGGAGRLVGAVGRGMKAAVGFDMPCIYYPGIRIVGDSVEIAKDEGYPVDLPYDFIVRSFPCTG